MPAPGRSGEPRLDRPTAPADDATAGVDHSTGPKPSQPRNPAAHLPLLLLAPLVTKEFRPRLDVFREENSVANHFDPLSGSHPWFKVVRRTAHVQLLLLRVRGRHLRNAPAKTPGPKRASGGNQCLDLGGRSALGSKREAFALEAFRRPADNAKPSGGQNLGQHDLHLEFGEAGTQATAHSASEGNPGGVLRNAVEEALGAELIRLRVALRVAVYEINGPHQDRAGRDRVSAELDLLRHVPGDHGHDRSRPQGLL